MKWRTGKAAALLAITVLAALALPAAAQRRRPNRPPPVNLPKGPVRQVILDNCTACHGIDDYAFYALDRAGWDTLLENKHQERKAVISDKNRAVLLDYLADQFGPNSKPFKPPQDRGVTDAAVRRILDNVCNTCHTLERVNTARNTEEMWLAIVTDMRSKGARLTDADIETLVQYFAKAQGAN